MSFSNGFREVLFVEVRSSHRGRTAEPPGRWFRRGLLAVTVAASLTAVGWPAAASAIGVSASASAPAAKPVAAAVAKTASQPTVQTVTLVTGDRVIVTTVDGKSTYSVTAASGHSEGFASYQGANGDHYVIPAEATPYLNKQLSTSLFDVTALLRAGLTTGSHIPVDLSFGAGSAVTAPPGVTLTSHTGSSAQGYVTAASGSAFAAGLRADLGADVRAGRAAGTAPLFGGLGSMGLATPAVVAAAAVKPDYPLFDLQVNTNDMTGAPDDNVVIDLVNTDSLAKMDTLLFPSGGIDRIAVPAGHYSMLANFFDLDSQGDTTANRLVEITDLTVAASGSTSVSIDESAAVHPVTFSTPLPATSNQLTAYWSREDSTGVIGQISLGQDGSAPTYINSQPAAKVGKMRLVWQWSANGPATGAQYRYDLAYGSDRISANQTYVVKSSQLATVHQTIYADPAAIQQGDEGVFMAGPSDSFDVAYGTTGDSTAPGALTEYVGVADGGGWWQGYILPGEFFLNADLHTFKAGHSYWINWAQGPLAPNVGTHTGPQPTNPCFDCASGSSVFLSLSTAGDSEPDHTSWSFGAASQLTVYQNGKKVASNLLTGVSTTAPTAYRLVYTTDMTGTPGVSQSVTTSTDVKFTYTPGLNSGNSLPDSLDCEQMLQTTTQCQILPVLNLDYRLGADDTNTSAVGPQLLGLTVDHLMYDGIGSHSAITSAKVSVSFNNGKTWTAAKMVGANGTYVALWSNPASAAGTSPELRVSATDAAGGSIVQTVTDAYSIAAQGVQQ